MLYGTNPNLVQCFEDRQLDKAKALEIAAKLYAKDVDFPLPSDVEALGAVQGRKAALLEALTISDLTWSQKGTVIADLIGDIWMYLINQGIEQGTAKTIATKVVLKSGGNVFTREDSLGLSCEVLDSLVGAGHLNWKTKGLLIKARKEQLVKAILSPSMSPEKAREVATRIIWSKDSIKALRDVQVATPPAAGQGQANAGQGSANSILDDDISYVHRTLLHLFLFSNLNSEALTKTIPNRSPVGRAGEFQSQLQRDICDTSDGRLLLLVAVASSPHHVRMACSLHGPMR